MKEEDRKTSVSLIHLLENILYNESGRQQKSRSTDHLNRQHINNMINKDILLGLLLIKLLLQLYLLIQSTGVNIHYIPYFHTKHLLLMMSHDRRFN